MITLYKGGDVDGDFVNVASVLSRWGKYFCDNGYAVAGSDPVTPEPEPAPAPEPEPEEDAELAALEAEIEALDSDDKPS